MLRIKIAPSLRRFALKCQKKLVSPLIYMNENMFPVQERLESAEESNGLEVHPVRGQSRISTGDAKCPSGTRIPGH